MQEPRDGDSMRKLEWYFVYMEFMPYINHIYIYIDIHYEVLDFLEINLVSDSTRIL